MAPPIQPNGSSGRFDLIAISADCRPIKTVNGPRFSTWQESCMSSYLVGAVAVGCLLGFNVVEAASLPAPTVDYSADRVIESEAGTFTGKVYATKDKERTEISMR